MADIITPVGRIVWGNPLNSKPKMTNTRPPQPVIDPKTGQQVMQWSFGLAIPKDQCGAIFQAMQQEAMTIFPTGQTPQNFAWKFKDGDGIDDKGIPFANRDGYKGCIALSISTEAFAPRIVRLTGGSYQQMTEGVKCGDFVRVALNIKAHVGKTDVRGSVPGLYLNPTMIEFVGYGQEIISGPDASTLFGGAAVTLPAGASATPVAPPQQMPTGMPGQPVVPAVPGMMPGNPQVPAVPGQPAQAAGAPYMPGNAPMNLGSPTGAAQMSPSNAPTYPGFVNQVMPGMLPGQ